MGFIGPVLGKLALHAVGKALDAGPVPAVAIDYYNGHAYPRVDAESHLDFRHHYSHKNHTATQLAKEVAVEVFPPDQAQMPPGLEIKGKYRGIHQSGTMLIVKLDPDAPRTRLTRAQVIQRAHDVPDSARVETVTSKRERDRYGPMMRGVHYNSQQVQVVIIPHDVTAHKITEGTTPGTTQKVLTGFEGGVAIVKPKDGEAHAVHISQFRQEYGPQNAIRPFGERARLGHYEMDKFSSPTGLGHDLTQAHDHAKRDANAYNNHLTNIGDPQVPGGQQVLIFNPNQLNFGTAQTVRGHEGDGRAVRIPFAFVDGRDHTYHEANSIVYQNRAFGRTTVRPPDPSIPAEGHTLTPQIMGSNSLLLTMAQDAATNHPTTVNTADHRIGAHHHGQTHKGHQHVRGGR